MTLRSIAKFGSVLAACGALTLSATAVSAYDGTNCRAPGVCWEPKPGYPAKIKGSKYDPKHDPKEVAKQQAALDAQAGRNAKRAANFKKTGKWVYDVSKIQ